MRESTYQDYCAQIDQGANLPALRDTLTRALHERELAVAKLGPHAPFEVTDALAKLKDLLARLDRREGRGEPAPDAAPPLDPERAAEERRQAEEARQQAAAARRQADHEEFIAKMRATLTRNLAHYLSQAAQFGLDDVPFRTVREIAHVCGRLRQLEQPAEIGAPLPPAESPDLTTADLFTPQVLRYLDRDKLAQIEQTLRSALAILERQRDETSSSGQLAQPRVTLAIDLTQRAADACRAAQQA